MRYEVYETHRGETRIVKTGIRRENGAIAERDIAAMDNYENKRKHAETGGAAVLSPHEKDPRCVVVTYVDADVTKTWFIGYRRVGEDEEWKNVDLVPALLASLYAIGVAPNI